MRSQEPLEHHINSTVWASTPGMGVTCASTKRVDKRWIEGLFSGFGFFTPDSDCRSRKMLDTQESQGARSSTNVQGV